MLTLTLPYPPSVNRYWRHYQGRVLISKEGREYRKKVQQYCLITKKQKPFTGFLKVKVQMWPPDRRRRDVDNIEKGLFDSLCKAGVYEDDYQIEDFHIIRSREPSPPGFVIVEICES